MDRLLRRSHLSKDSELSKPGGRLLGTRWTTAATQSAFFFCFFFLVSARAVAAAWASETFERLRALRVLRVLFELLGQLQLAAVLADLCFRSSVGGPSLCERLVEALLRCLGPPVSPATRHGPVRSRYVGQEWRRKQCCASALADPAPCRCAGLRQGSADLAQFAQARRWC